MGSRYRSATFARHVGWSVPGRHAATTPDKPAYVMAATGEVITYAELDAAANRVAACCAAAGVRPGDHVALCMENHPRYLEVLWGCHYAGAIYTAASSRLTSAELAYIVERLRRQGVHHVDRPRRAAADIVDGPEHVTTRLMIDGTVDGFDALRGGRRRRSSPTPLPDESEGADMLYSSGTTGRPKGVKPAAGRSRSATATSLVDARQVLFGIGPDTVYLSPAPLYHAAPLRFTMTVQRLGGTCVVMEHFDAEEFLALDRALPRHRTPRSCPTMFVRMLKLPTRSERALRPVVAACRHPRRRAVPDRRSSEQMIEWWGPIIHEYYAGTEGNGFALLNSRGVAGPPRLGRPADHRHAAHLRRRRQRAARRRARHRSTSSGGDAVRVPQRPGEDARARAPPRAGPRSATSATSTTTATST